MECQDHCRVIDVSVDSSRQAIPNNTKCDRRCLHQREALISTSQKMCRSPHTHRDLLAYVYVYVCGYTQVNLLIVSPVACCACTRIQLCVKSI